MPTQLHKRFSDEEMRQILTQYEEGRLDIGAALLLLKVGKSRFFELCAAFRTHRDTFTIHYERNSPSRITKDTEQLIMEELKKEKKLIVRARSDKRLRVLGLVF